MDKKAVKIQLSLVILGLSFIVIFPSILAILLTYSLFSFAPGKVDSWISFWGSYLGGIVGLIGVVITTFILISNQKKQHYDLLTEQKKSIDAAAELNDKKTREREHKLFLLKKNEKIIDLIVSLMKLIKLRNEILRKINNIGLEIFNLVNFQKSIINNEQFQDKISSIINVTLEQINNNKMNTFRESELLAEMEIQIGEIKTLYILLDYDTKEIEKLNNIIQENSTNMINLANDNKYGPEYHQGWVSFDKDITEELNQILHTHVTKHKLLFEEYKK